MIHFVLGTCSRVPWRRAVAAWVLAATAAAAAVDMPPVRPAPVRVGDEIARVETAAGTVLGYEQGGLWIFKGIPYAQASRFHAPQPVPPWTRPRSSRAWGAVCPQAAGAEFDQLAFVVQRRSGWQSEDCLNLNVWTTGPKGRRPVMVWLHGGAYSTGSSGEAPVTDGSSLAQGGVVVVSLNHRLNVLGFLDLSLLGQGHEDSANAGLLDIVEGLHWVRENIAAFGGDPTRVTLFGQSGGGSKVGDLMTMPMAQGLFHGAIIQSSFRDALHTPARSRQIAERTLALLHLDPRDPDSARRLAAWPYAELAAASAAALAELQREAEASGEHFPAPVGLGYGPTHDGRILPWQPDAVPAATPAARVPLIVGSTHHEFGMAARPAALRGIAAGTVATARAQRFGAREAQALAALAEAHPGWPEDDWLDADLNYRRRSVELALRHARAGGRVWRYLFDWQAPVLDGFFKVGHGAEMPFVFDNVARAAEATGGGPEAYALAAQLSAAWRAFAAIGDPRGGLPAWAPWTEVGGETLVIGQQRSVLRRQPDRAWLDLNLSR